MCSLNQDKTLELLILSIHNRWALFNLPTVQPSMNQYVPEPTRTMGLNCIYSFAKRNSLQQQGLTQAESETDKNVSKTLGYNSDKCVKYCFGMILISGLLLKKPKTVDPLPDILACVAPIW